MDDDVQPIIMARPVNGSSYTDPERRRLWREAVAAGLPTEPYSGSITDVCHDCGIAVWVGPRQLEAMASMRGEAEVLCPVCIALLADGMTTGAEIEFSHLGNPETPGTSS